MKGVFAVATDYSRIMYKQYMEVMERLEKMEAAHKEDRVEIRELNGHVKSLQKTGSILEDKCSRLETGNKSLKEQVDGLTKENHLLFLHDFRVPYSNNMSERDLRKCKNREKMAGGFRKKEGRQMFCRILSFIETVKRRKKNLFASIIALFKGEPVIQ